MSLEDDFKTIMDADGTLTGILTGGIFTSGTVGRVGITAQAYPSILDVDGNLKPVALVKERDINPDYQVEDKETQNLSLVQVVEIWLYEEVDYANIDAALTRLQQLFLGHIFSNSFEAEWILTINREQDQGALAGASLARQDWLVSSVI